MADRRTEQGQPRTGHWFLWLVSIPIVGILVLAAASTPRLIVRPEVGTFGDLILWTLAVAGVGLFPVPVSRRLHLNLNYPILLGVAMLYPPVTAACVALV